MEKRTEILPGVFLCTVTTDKFKTSCFSINFLRPHGRQEASLNALLPSVLLRGTQNCPDIAAVSERLDDLYGATLGSLVRKKGGVQLVGIYCDFIEDCYLPAGEEIFTPVVDFAAEVLLAPKLEGGVFTELSVSGEKRNLMNALEAQKNDKRSYLVQMLVAQMFRGEPAGVPQLGYAEDVAQITAQSLYAHYQTILAQSRVEIFYMGGKTHEQAAAVFAKALQKLPRTLPITRLPVAAVSGASGQVEEQTLRMDVVQGKLAIGLRTNCTAEDAEYPAMMLLNTVLGGGMTSKLFVNVREKRSLCYYAMSSMDKYRGLMVISSGVEFDKLEVARDAILQELEACRRGEISNEEIENARKVILSALQGMMDAPGRLDDFYLGVCIYPNILRIPALMEQIKALTVQQLVAAAQKIQNDTIFYLRGMDE